MTQITALQVNQLRKNTGAGMMDCKKALVEASGDFEQAILILRKKGQKVIANRSEMESLEGVTLAGVCPCGTNGYAISLNCETDFVAKNENFISFAKILLQKALDKKVDSKESLLALDFNGISVSEKILEQTGIIGEKIELKKIVKIKAPAMGYYIHAGNKIAVLVGLSKKIDDYINVAKDIAMQIAAMNPIAIDEKFVSEEIKAKELEIAKDQLRQEGKTEEMIEKIAVGKLNKYFKENTLLNQSFIKNNKQTVKDYLKSKDKDLTVVSFERMSLV